MGFWDDFSYIWCARVLADTGHIVYNGWETAILGWQLYWGALFIKLFGFSFNALHVSGLILAMATAALTQRVFVRTGLTEWNATIATLCLTLSPVFLPLCFTFMSDVPGFLCMLVCLYGCLRALQAATDRAALGWLVFAALTNAVGGTARQIAWLGVLVMVPFAIWLLRRRRGILAVGIPVWIASVAFVIACLQWFKHQPYSLREKLITASSFHHSPVLGIRITIFFCLPILVAFLPAIPVRKKGVQLQCAVAVVLLAVVGIWISRPAFYSGVAHEARLAPFSTEWVTARGLFQPPNLYVLPPFVLSLALRLVLTLLTGASLLALVICLFSLPSAQPARGQDERISSRTLWFLLGPSTRAYGLLIETRVGVLERYVIPLIFVLILALLRAYQSRIAPRISGWSLICTAVFAAYAVAQTHDFAAAQKARLAAVRQLQAAGTPRSQIRAGFDFDGWTELQLKGYANDPRIQWPPGAFHPVPPQTGPEACREDSWVAIRLPDIHPRYEFSYGPTPCFPESQFPPLVYRTWLPPWQREIYILAAQG